MNLIDYQNYKNQGKLEEFELELVKKLPEAVLSYMYDHEITPDRDLNENNRQKHLEETKEIQKDKSHDERGSSKSEFPSNFYFTSHKAEDEEEKVQTKYDERSYPRSNLKKSRNKLPE